MIDTLVYERSNDLFGSLTRRVHVFHKLSSEWRQNTTAQGSKSTREGGDRRPSTCFPALSVRLRF